MLGPHSQMKTPIFSVVLMPVPMDGSFEGP
jgi:hypothetical protein